MMDTGTYRSALWRRLVSESDTDPLNSTVNPRGNHNCMLPKIEQNQILIYLFPDLLMNHHILARGHIYSRNRREWKRELTR